MADITYLRMQWDKYKSLMGDMPDMGALDWDSMCAVLDTFEAMESY